MARRRPVFIPQPRRLNPIEYEQPVYVDERPARSSGTQSDFIDDMQRSIGSLMAGAGSALRDVNEDAGQWLQGWGNEIVQNNPADYADLSQIQGLGDLAGFAFERAMEFVPQFAGAVGASVAGSPLAGLAVLAAPTGISTYGEAREAQREQGVYDPLRAGLAATAAAGLDVLGVGRVLPGKGAIIKEVFEQGLKGAAKEGAKTGTEETLTEVGQQALQRYGGYQDLTSPEAIQEYAFSGLAGGILGGGIGAGRAALSSAPSAAPEVPPAGAEPFSAFTPMATAQPIEAPPGLAEAPALRTVDIADVTAPEEGAMTTLQILTEPDERGNLWVRTPEGEVSPMNKFTLDILTGGDVGVEAPVTAPGEAGLTTPAISVTKQPISAVPITQPIDVTEPAPVITPEAPEVTAAAPKVGIRRAIWAGPEYDIPIEVLDEPSQAGPDGNMYQQVRTPEGNTTFVPYNQIRFEDVAPPAAPIDVTGTEAAPPEPSAPEMPDAVPPTAPPIGMQVPEVEPAPEVAPAPAPEQYVFTREKAEEVGSHDPQLAKALIGKTASGGAEALAQRTTSPFYKQLATRVAGVARAMESAGIRMPIGITGIPGGQGMASEGTMRATRRPSTGGVTNLIPPLESGPYTAFEVGMKGKPTGTVPRGANERTLLHELLHSVTTGAQRMADQFPADSRMGQALKDIKVLHKTVLSGVRSIESGKLQVSDDVKSSLARLHTKIGRRRSTNAFLNERELIAWGLTDFDMQNVLKAIPTKKGNAFTDFVASIAKMLGVGPKDYNALRNLIELSEVVIPEDTAAQQEMIDVVTGRGQPPLSEPEAGAVTDTEATAQTESPALKAWFGDSKVVDADGKPLVVYHGTQGGDFNIFKPGSWFSDNPSESSAYTFWSDLNRRQKATGKYKMASGADLAGKRLPYFGTLSDIDNPKVGEIYATDNGVFKSLGNGKWEIYTDLAKDYKDFDYDSMTVVAQKGDSRKNARKIISEYENAVAKRWPGGLGGRVYPVYLSIKNPIKLDPLEANRLARRLGMGSPEIMAKIREYEAAGYDGIETTSDEATMNPEIAAEMGGVPKQWIAFRPEQIKSATGNVGTFDATRPEIDMEAAAPSEPSPTESQSARESRIRRSLNALRTSKFYQNIGSKYAGARAADQALAQSYGLKELPEASSLAGAFEVYEATKSAQLRKLKSGYIDPVNQAAEDATKNGVTPDDWNDALQARAAKARNAKIAEASKDKNGVPKIPDGGSGMTNAQADETLAALQLSGKMPYINKVLEAHDRLRDYSQKIAVESGLISRQTMDAWKKAEPDYTPFKGWAASGDNVIPGQPDPHGEFGSVSFTRQFGANGRPFRQAKGRSTAAANSLYNMVADAQYIVEMAEKNKVTMQLKSMYRNNPGAFQGLIRVYDALNPKFIKGKPAKFSDPKAFKNAIRGFENGKVFFIETAPTEEGQTLLSAYQNMSPPQYAEWVKKLNNAMSALRGLNTRYNPTFWPREFLRSVEDAVNTVYIEKGRKESAAYGKAAALNAFKYSWRPSTLGGVRAFITNTDPRSEEAQVAKERVAEMVANGGEAGFEFAERAAAVAERMEKALRELTTEGERKKTLETKAGMMKMMKAVNGINEFVDLAPRAAAYMALTDAGVPVKEAARIALRSTLDHTKRGRYASLLDSLFWFTTPSITNLTKKVRALDSATGRRLMIAHTALGFGIAFLNMMNAPDSDDDGENDYSQLPEWRKLAFTHIYYSPDASPLVLPTGFLFAFERYLGSKLAEVMSGSASETQAATSITKAASDVGSAFLHTLPSMIGGVDGRSIVPSVLAPMYDLAVNENYFNSPIYNKPFDESVAKASISKASTPQIYKDIAEGLQSATGGFGRVRGGIDVSPDQLKYFVDQYTGGTGQFVRGLATGDIEQLAKVNPLDFDPNLIRNAPIQRFYERAPLMKRAAYVEKNGTADELDQFTAAYPVESNPYVIGAYQDSVQEMKDLSEAREGMSPEEYRDERNAIMSRFNQIYNQVKKEREE